MFETFPLTREQIFKLPDLAVDKQTSSDTYKSLFLNEILALDLSAKRNLKPANYLRNPDGGVTLSLQEIILDVSTFYLFAHKTLVSALFIFAKTLPHSMQSGISFSSYTKFMNRVRSQDNDVLKFVYSNFGKNLSWAQKAIVNKRDDLVQHWQSNASNKFFTSIYATDLPLLIYYNPKLLDRLNEDAVDILRDKIASRLKATMNDGADIIQKIAWMEAWCPELNQQLEREVDALLDNEVFISLPVTPQLVNKLDRTIAELISGALILASRTIDNS